MAAWLAAVVLSAAVLGGLGLAIAHVRRHRVPAVAGVLHGGLALLGAALLTAAVWRAAQPPAINTALLCVALALVGGGFVYLFRRQGDAPPGFMIALHGGAGALGAALLWIGLG